MPEEDRSFIFTVELQFVIYEQGSVVRRVDNVIHWIAKLASVVYGYPLDSFFSAG